MVGSFDGRSTETDSKGSTVKRSKVASEKLKFALGRKRNNQKRNRSPSQTQNPPIKKLNEPQRLSKRIYPAKVDAKTLSPPSKSVAHSTHFLMTSCYLTPRYVEFWWAFNQNTKHILRSACSYSWFFHPCLCFSWFRSAQTYTWTLFHSCNGNRSMQQGSKRSKKA